MADHITWACDVAVLSKAYKALFIYVKLSGKRRLSYNYKSAFLLVLLYWPEGSVDICPSM